MGQLPKTSSLMDLNQVVSLTGHLSWGLSMPSTISFGDTALLIIKGDAPPYTWAVIGNAAYTEEYSLKYTETKKPLNVLKSELGAINLPNVEVVDARGNRITQSMIEIPLPPTADLTGDTPVIVGLSGDYDASGSTPGVGASIKKYEWDWKYDGLSFTPSGDLGSTNSHTYVWPGNYIVAVRVRDNYNRTDIATLPVVITIPDAPTAGLTGDQILDIDATGNYDATSSTPGVGGTIVSYEWDWDYDGVTFNASGDTGSTQSHSWSSEDSYTVAVKVTDDWGSSDIATLEVVVMTTSLLWEDSFTGTENITVHVAETGHRYYGPGFITGGVLPSGSTAIIKNTTNTGLETFGNKLDGMLTLTLGTVNGRPIYRYIRMRYLDDNNYLYLDIADSGSATTIRLLQTVSSVTTPLSDPVTVSIATGDTITIIVLGETFIAMVKTGETVKATVTNSVTPLWAGGYGIALITNLTDGIAISHGTYEG